MIILAFDSTAKAASVAITDDDKLLALYNIDNGLTQSELLLPMAENMLKLAGFPIWAKDRAEDCPIIIGGGPCVYNSEPVADFFDLINIGEGEEVLLEISHLYDRMKQDGSYTVDVRHILIMVEGGTENSDGTPVTEATFPVTDDCGYFRITVMDAQGRCADTNAYFVDELI